MCELFELMRDMFVSESVHCYWTVEISSSPLFCAAFDMIGRAVRRMTEISYNAQWLWRALWRNFCLKSLHLPFGGGPPAVNLFGHAVDYSKQTYRLIIWKTGFFGDCPWLLEPYTPCAIRPWSQSIPMAWRWGVICLLVFPEQKISTSVTSSL